MLSNCLKFEFIIEIIENGHKHKHIRLFILIRLAWMGVYLSITRRLFMKIDLSINYEEKSKFLM